MKKFLFTLFALSALAAFSQVPQKISYQGVARNVSGTVLGNQSIGLKFIISNGIGSVYEETHPVNTNAFGLFTVFIGGGTATLGSFPSINWSTGTYFLEVLIDPAGGTSYTSVGTQQFMSVPYALYAQTAGNASPTPTITINAPNTVTGAAGSYIINVPTQTLSINSNQISISNGNTITLPTPTVYSAGSGIDINGTSVITGTANIVGTGATTVTGTYPNLTINTPTTQVYSAGTGINITATGVISNTATAITPTIVGTGIANVTPTTGNNFTVSVPQPTLTYNTTGNVLTLTQGSYSTTAALTGTGSSTINMIAAGIASVSPTSGSAFTVSVQSPTYTANGPTTITGSYPNLTINSAASPSTTLVQGTNVTLNQSGNTYTINAAASPSTTLVQGNNVTLNQSGSTYTVNAAPYSLSSNSNTLTLTNGTVVSTATVPAITLPLLSYTASATNGKLQSGPGTNTVSIPNYTLSNASNTITLSNGSASSSAIIPVPTLTLTGNILQSGPPTNTVNLSTVTGLWSASSTTAIVQTNTLNNVGIGMPSPAPQFKLDVAATAGNSVTIHGFNTGSTDAFAGVFGENTSTGVGVYAQSNGGKGVFGKSTSGSGVYGESISGDAGKFNMNGSGPSYGIQVQTNGTGAALFAKSNFTSNPLAAKFDGNVDIQNTGSASGKLINAVQTNSVSDGFSLDVTHVNNGGNALQIRNFGMGKASYFEISNTANSGPAVEAVTNGTGTTGFFNNTNASSSVGAILAQSSSLGAAMRAISTNTVSAGAHAIVAQAVSGGALSATNSSTVAATILATNSGAGNVIFSTANDGLAFYGTNNSSSGNSVMELASNGDGVALQVYKNAGATGNVASFSNNNASSSSDAVSIYNVGAANSLSSSNTNVSPTAYAGVFDGGIISKGKTSTSAAYAFRALNSAATSLFSVRNDGIVEINGNVGINVFNPTNKLHVNSSNTNAAAFIENIITGSSANAHGVFAKTSSTHSLAAAVYGNANGAGPSIYGIKSPSETGIAGRFELLNNGNSADAVLAKTDGSGAAIHAVSSTTTNMVSTVALWVENGHIKSTGASVTTGALNVSGGFIVPSFAPILTNCTDVKGTFSFTTSATGILANAYIELQIVFSKGYPIPPTVVVTSSSDLQGLNYMVTSVTGSSFFVRLYRTGNAIIATPTSIPNGSLFKFNYMVIE